MKNQYWTLPVTWQVCGEIKIPKSEAPTIEDAIDYFDRHYADEIRLPEESSYVDASFELSCREPEYIELFNRE